MKPQLDSLPVSNTSRALPADVCKVSSFLGGRSFESWWDEFDSLGFVVLERVLSPDQVEGVRTALSPYLAPGRAGRNDFEGFKTNRIYALLAKSPVFAELAMHPLALAFAEAELGQRCLLSACLAINLLPGETVQPWHFDDSGVKGPRPRRPYGVSAFWAIDDTTEDKGATEVIPGSHLWGDEMIAGAAEAADFANATLRAPDDDPAARPDAVKLTMPSGSLAIAKGTLWHRGGANKSRATRLIITPQYCVGWARQLENMSLAVPPHIAATLPRRAQELLGYSIHPPFMGHVDGVHPRRLLAPAAALRDATEIAAGRGLRAARLRALKADIGHNLAGDVTVAALSARHRLSPRYIRKLFEGENTSLSQFVLGQRLTHVHRMLTDPCNAGLTIAHIAFAVGFGDLSTFNRQFRRCHGVTPSDVRRGTR